MARLVSKWFGAVLILTGASAFFIPADMALMSGAPPYDVFHIVFGAVGVLCARRTAAARAFCAGFGALDLYQALAQRLGWWPGGLFLWKPADFWLHVALGAALVAAAARRE